MDFMDRMCAEEARAEYERMYYFDDQNKIKEALESADEALICYSSICNWEKAGDVYVFLGDFKSAEREYWDALKKAEQGRSSYYKHNPEEAYRYGSALLDAETQRIQNKLDYVSRGETPPYLRKIKRDNRNEISLIAFDLDGTLTNAENNIWFTLNERFGLGNESKELAERYYKGEFNYIDWASKALDLLYKKGANEKTLYEAIGSIGLQEGVYRTLFELKDRKKRVAILSGSLDIVVRKLFGPEEPEFTGRFFDSIIINRIYFNDAGGIKGFGPTHYGDGGYKADGLKDLAQRFGFRLKQCAYIGDGENDVEVAKIAGLSIAFNPKSDKLREVCNAVIEKNNLELILPHIFSKDGT